MPDKKIFIQLSVDDKGSVVLKQFDRNTKEAMKGVESAVGGHIPILDRAKQHWLGLTAAVAGAMGTIHKVRELMEKGARALQAEESFRLMARSAGENADEMLKHMKDASKGLIGTTDLMQKASKALAQGMKGDEIISFSRAARYAARLTGEDVVTAYENITDAIANQMPRALRRYGLVTKEEMELMNKALAAGVEDIRLVDIALANAAIQEARFSGATDQAVERTQRFRNEISALEKAVGIQLVNAVGEAIEAFKNFDLEKLAKTSTFLAAVKLLFEMSKKANELGIGLADRMKKEPGAPAPQTENEIETWSGEAVLQAERNKREKIAALNDAIAQKETQKKLAEIAKLNQSIEDATAKLTLSETAQAERQAQIWRDQGADRVKVAAWTAAQIEVIRQKESDQWADHVRRIMQENEREYQEIKAVQDQIDAVKLTGMARVHKEAELLRERGVVSEEKIQEWIAAKEIETRRNAYETVKEFAQGYRLFQKEQLEDLARTFREAGIEEIDIERWKTSEIKKYALQRAQFVLENTQSESEAVMARFEIMSLQMRSNAQIWADGMAEAFDGGFKTINEVFFDALEGRMKSFTDYMQAFKSIINRVLADIASEMLKATVLKGITGGGGGLLSLLGIGGGSAVSGTYGLDMAGGDFGGLDMAGFAAGGRPPLGRPSLVGEKGPELFVPDRPGTIVPNGQFGSVTINVPVSVEGGSKRLAAELRRNIEHSVQETVKGMM